MSKDMFEMIREREEQIRSEERNKIIAELLTWNGQTDVTIDMVVQMIESRGNR